MWYTCYVWYVWCVWYGIYVCVCMRVCVCMCALLLVSVCVPMLSVCVCACVSALSSQEKRQKMQPLSQGPSPYRKSSKYCSKASYSGGVSSSGRPYGWGWRWRVVVGVCCFYSISLFLQAPSGSCPCSLQRGGFPNSKVMSENGDSKIPHERIRSEREVEGGLSETLAERRPLGGLHLGLEIARDPKPNVYMTVVAFLELFSPLHYLYRKKSIEDILLHATKS